MKCKRCALMCERENERELCEDCADIEGLVWSRDDEMFVETSRECGSCEGYENWCGFCQTYTQTCCVDYGTCECS